MRLLWTVLGLFLSFTQSTPVLSAGTPINGFIETTVASPFNQPTAFAFAPDGRIFVCEQAGTLRVIKAGTLLATPFVTLPVDSLGERGLLGVALDPAFAQNQLVYVYYTVGTIMPRRNRVSRFTANGDVALAGSEQILLELGDLNDSTTHNGGALRFGPHDGKLYIGVGEDGVGANSQLLTNLLGKVLRMNPDGSTPVDNPIQTLGTQGKNQLIWAYGLRNPFTFTFDPKTFQMFINDVGQDSYEEVNLGVAGGNYGWPLAEGYASDPAFKAPQFAYPHDLGLLSGCAIAGGAFYNPTNPTFPTSFMGKYFFADLCNSWIFYMNSTGEPLPAVFLTGAQSPVGIEVGPDGNLYYLERGFGGSTGAVKRITSTHENLPHISAHPQNVQVAIGAPATFSVTASSPQPLTYQWQRNAFAIPGATSSTYTLPVTQLGDSGASFRVLIRNSVGDTLSNSAVLTVLSGTPPTATITAPPQGTLFSAGGTIAFSGTAQDQLQNPIAPSTFRWRVDYITGSATRPFLQEFTGPGGSFTVPQVTPYTQPDVYFLIYLTVTDSQGLQTTVSRRVDPRVAPFTLTSSPPGLQLTLDGQPFTAPSTVNSVVGLIRPIGAINPTAGATTRQAFTSWSDGGAMTHDITVGATAATYTATFTTQHLLTTIANPLASGSITGGGWINAGVNQTITATAAAGYRFTGFSGDLTGASPQSILMNAPHTVTANFECAYSLSSSAYTAGADGGTIAINVTAGSGCAWNATGAPDWITVSSGASGNGSGIVNLVIRSNTGSQQRSATLTVAGLPFVVTQSTGAVGQCSTTLSQTNGSVTAFGGVVSVNVNATGATCPWTVLAPDAWVTVSSGGGMGSGTLLLTVGVNPTSQARISQLTIAGQSFTLTQQGTSSQTAGLGYVPLTPCRLMETRPEYNFQGRTGAFGPPFLVAGESRILIPSLSKVCQIPSTAKAYVVNVTLVPRGAVDYVTLWPAGAARPNVWTARSLDGLIVANSSIVAAGQGGAIGVYTTSNTDVVIDVSGYFTDDRSIPTSAYYPMAPCRVIETRSLYRPAPGPFGPPTLNAGERRTFRFPAPSPYCSVREGAKAYAVTITAVPPGSLPFLAAWPTSGAQPNVSVLNSPLGRVIANNVIVPASNDGSIDILALERTDIIVDITGYFAANDGTGLYYFPVTQCRAFDSNSAGILQDDSTRTIAVPAATQCSGISPNAKAYALNVTAMPGGQPMPFLTLYATGQPRPNASILNAFEGQVMTNSAIIPAGTNGAVDVYAFKRTHVQVEVSGYFGR